MPPADTQRKNNTQTADLSERPEPEFWQRYSPHHEFSLSTVTAIGVCCLAAGVVALAAVLAGMNWRSDARKPAEMDAVEIAGGGGTDGAGPLGAGLNAKGNEAKAENVTQQQAKAENTKPTPPTQKLINPPVGPLVKVEEPTPKDNETGEPTVFDEIRKEAEKQVAASMKQPMGSSGKQGLTNPGKGGGVGGGEGPGSGYKKGPGGGTSDTGVVRTLRQRRELRWRIDFSGTGEQHLAKLRALGVTLAIPAGPRGLFAVMDLTHKPPTTKMTNLSQEQNKIKWFNTSPPSLRELARVLRLQSVPPFVVIFLPEAMEQEMIRLEHDFKGLKEHEIELTEFEIRSRGDGGFGPVVTNQVPRKR